MNVQQLINALTNMPYDKKVFMSVGIVYHEIYEVDQFKDGDVFIGDGTNEVTGIVIEEKAKQ